MKQKTVNEKRPSVAGMVQSVGLQELTGLELTVIEGGCNKCDRNHDGKISAAERILCGLKPWPRLPKIWPRPPIFL